jgi:hypothetical protein
MYVVCMLKTSVLINLFLDWTFLLLQFSSEKAPEEDPVQGLNMLCQKCVKILHIALVICGCVC